MDNVVGLDLYNQTITGGGEDKLIIEVFND